jgi:hypothetical protein
VSDIGRVFNRNPPPIFLLEATFRPTECLIGPTFYLPRAYYLSAAKGLRGNLVVCRSCAVPQMISTLRFRRLASAANGVVPSKSSLIRRAV